MYLRFVTSDKIPNMAARRGLFGATYAQLRRPDIDPKLRVELQEQLDWFEDNLAVPDRFNKSKSKGAYRRKTKGLAWFVNDGNEAVTRGYALARLLKRCGYTIEELRSSRIGYVIYKDALQAIAEPFNDTPT